MASPLPERSEQFKLVPVRAPGRRAPGDRAIGIRSVLQERFHESEIASQHSRMQWGIADSSRVRVGTVLQQKRANCAVAAMSGHD